jgi:hypothetical protein
VWGIVPRLFEFPIVVAAERWIQSFKYWPERTPKCRIVLSTAHFLMVSMLSGVDEMHPLTRASPRD